MKTLTIAASFDYRDVGSATFEVPDSVTLDEAAAIAATVISVTARGIVVLHVDALDTLNALAKGTDPQDEDEDEDEKAAR